MDITKTYEEIDKMLEQNEDDKSEISFLDKAGDYDLTLIVEDRKINVCRAVLCVASPVFQTMFKSDFKEKDQTEIELPEKNYEDFVEFLCCFYPDKLKYLTEQNVYRVLPFAIEYQVKVLEDRSHMLLLQLVNDRYTADETEIYRHLHIAELFDFEELKTRCIELASELSLDKMDKGSSEYPVSDKTLLQIRYLALQKNENALQGKEFEEEDDMYLFRNASMWVNKTNGESVTYKAIVRRKVEDVSTYSSCSDLLRAARLWARYFSNDTTMLPKITDKLNAKKPHELSQFKRELELLPEAVKKSLTIK